MSRTDNVQAAAANGKNAWMPPVIVSKQVSQTIFSDKEQIWADNAASSPFFGTVYVCWASFVGQENSPNAAPAPLFVGVSHDGGDTWTQQQITPAANNGQRNPTDGCTVRTDSHGTAYVFGVGTVSSLGHDAFELMSTSTDGGKRWSKGAPVAGPVMQPGTFDPVLGRPVIDGVAGARSDLAPAPSVDIANGAPTGADATNRIVMTYVSGDLAKPHVYFTESTERKRDSWSSPRAIEGGKRSRHTTPPRRSRRTVRMSTSSTTRSRRRTSRRRRRRGRSWASSNTPTSGTGPTGAFTEIHRSVPGDPRGSSPEQPRRRVPRRLRLRGGDEDVRRGGMERHAECGRLPCGGHLPPGTRDGQSAAAPAIQQQCPPTFGNSDIRAFTTAP